jgi:hypothetical protein
LDYKEDTPPDWSRIFKGYDADIEENRDRIASDNREILDQTASNKDRDQDYKRDYICLTYSKVESLLAQITFNINSFLRFAQDLAFARQGVNINLFPCFYTNIQTDLYLYTTVYYDFRRGLKPVRVKLQKVLYYCAGRVIGHKDITLYIFFLKMYTPDKVTNFPRKGDREKHNLL